MNLKLSFSDTSSAYTDSLDEQQTLRTKCLLKLFNVHIPYWDYKRTISCMAPNCVVHMVLKVLDYYSGSGAFLARTRSKDSSAKMVVSKKTNPFFRVPMRRVIT